MLWTSSASVLEKVPDLPSGRGRRLLTKMKNHLIATVHFAAALPFYVVLLFCYCHPKRAAEAWSMFPCEKQPPETAEPRLEKASGKYIVGGIVLFGIMSMTSLGTKAESFLYGISYAYAFNGLHILLAGILNHSSAVILQQLFFVVSMLIGSCHFFHLMHLFFKLYT
ncbi:hypothetical protein HPB50_002901 [Hyalomma asiaticum]|uniref:Uncharacterized protein n=1 Tax=Hyalomma asiaticum TaxID=266040 RepID=A0ACB7TEC0_HYAAI|nr:hypothetical protein HPB50_002901 [Hyalomma asiaticum]